MLKELTCLVKPDEIAVEIAKMFDYKFDGVSRFVVPEFSIGAVPSNFGIGLIVGASGSGKSTLLRLFGEERFIEWDIDRAICSHFEGVDDARDRLSGVGFNSIPAWMRPYRVLSTGERFRADLARRLCDGAVIDEFTSVVDRSVAKSCACSVKRYIDAKGLRRIVFASCHRDIVDWLRPDWIFDTDTRLLSADRGLLQRPEIILEVVPCSSEAWLMFRDHHYLSGDINKSSRCWIATWDGVPVGFAAAVSFPSGTINRAYREHRTVILPDYQGLGLGVRLSDCVGEIFVRMGYRYFSKTAHFRMGEYRNASRKWRKTSKNMMVRDDYKLKLYHKEGKYQLRHAERFCYSHEYVG